MDSLSSVSPSFVLPPGKPLRHHHHRRRISVSSKVKLAHQLRLSLSSRIPRTSFGHSSDSGIDRRRTVEAYCKLGGGEGGDDEDEGRRRDEEVESALRMDGTIPGTPNEFVKQVSSRAYDMRRHLQQTFDSSSYDGIICTFLNCFIQFHLNKLNYSAQISIAHCEIVLNEILQNIHILFLLYLKIKKIARSCCIDLKQIYL